MVEKKRKKIDKNTFCVSLITLYGFMLVYIPMINGKYQLGDIFIGAMFVVSIIAYLLPNKN